MAFCSYGADFFYFVQIKKENFVFSSQFSYLFIPLKLHYNNKV